jgi:hypothetical protein
MARPGLNVCEALLATIKIEPGCSKKTVILAKGLAAFLLAQLDQSEQALEENSKMIRKTFENFTICVDSSVEQLFLQGNFKIINQPINIMMRDLLTQKCVL